MKVTTWVDLGEKEVAVELSLDEVFAALVELGGGSNSVSGALEALNVAGGMIARVSDTSIAKMNARQRALVRGALQRAADRFLAGPESLLRQAAEISEDASDGAQLEAVRS